MTARADDGVVAVGQGRDQLVHLGVARRRLDVGVGGVGPGVPQVLADGGVQQVRLLETTPTSSDSSASGIDRRSTPSMRTD